MFYHRSSQFRFENSLIGAEDVLLPTTSCSGEALSFPPLIDERVRLEGGPCEPEVIAVNDGS